MNVRKVKALVNAVCELTDEKYDYDYTYEKDEDEELLRVMSKNVEIQMWSKAFDRKQRYGTSAHDINCKRYKGRDKAMLEEYRLEGLEKITEETDPLKKLSIFYEYSRELRENMKMLDFMDYVSNETHTLVSIEVCSNLFNLGKLTLSEMRSIMPWLKKSDIYGLSKMLGKDVSITEEELDEVKAEYSESGEPEVLKDIFGDPNKVKQKRKKNK